MRAAKAAVKVLVNLVVMASLLLGSDLVFAGVFQPMTRRVDAGD
jgi:hypothetical protein